MDYIVWNPTTQTALIVSPEQVEQLISCYCNPEATDGDVQSHLLLYSAESSNTMMNSFKNLNYYAIPSMAEADLPPSWLTSLVGLFAGRLYFDYSELETLRGFLGLRTDRDRVNGFVQPFTNQPVKFMQEWLALRWREHDFSDTPMSYLLQGRTLNADSHMFATNSDCAPALEHDRVPEVDDEQMDNLELDEDEDEDDCDLDDPLLGDYELGIEDDDLTWEDDAGTPIEGDGSDSQDDDSLYDC